MAPDGTGYMILHGFAGGATDGAGPNAPLIQADDGNLYGTTPTGGSQTCGNGCGIVFRMAPDGTGYIVLHFFGNQPNDGLNPMAALMQGTDGNLYSTTDIGGSPPGQATGTVYAIALDGTEYTVVYSFKGGPGDGSNPQSSLIQLIDGSLYGTTKAGGPFGSGEVFRLTFSPITPPRR